MVGMGVILGFIIFTVDLLLYGLYAVTNLDDEERKELIEKLKFTIPIGLFMQVFFALIFIFTFRFLAVFKALNPSIGGGLYFAYIMFLPMLYMLFNNWLWLETKKATTLLNILSWGFKLAICGIFVSIV
ncbi:hypothetical protein ACFL5G_00435 [Candidatus Margulisiibacteriota bacterium]